MVTRYFACTTPRRGGLRFGTATQFRAEQAVPRGRSRSFRAVNGGGRGARVNSRGDPAVAEQTKRIKSDSLQGHVERYRTLKKTPQFRFWRPCGTLDAFFFFCRIVMT